MSEIKPQQVKVPTEFLSLVAQESGASPAAILSATLQSGNAGLEGSTLEMSNSPNTHAYDEARSSHTDNAALAAGMLRGLTQEAIGESHRAMRMASREVGDPNHTPRQYGFSNGAPEPGSIGPKTIGPRDPNWTKEELKQRDLSTGKPKTL